MTIAEADTLVFIHGLWVTPRVWEHSIPAFERRGYRVLAPAYPGLEAEVEALREDPSPIEALTIPATLEHLGAVIADLENPAVLIGHGFGGTRAQIVINRGYGAARHRDQLGTDRRRPLAARLAGQGASDRRRARGDAGRWRTGGWRSERLVVVAGRVRGPVAAVA